MIMLCLAVTADQLLTTLMQKQRDKAGGGVRGGGTPPRTRHLRLEHERGNQGWKLRGWLSLGLMM